eukprot:766684-Hanusia_phi.AAC.8
MSMNSVRQPIIIRNLQLREEQTAEKWRSDIPAWANCSHLCRGSGNSFHLDAIKSKTWQLASNSSSPTRIASHASLQGGRGVRGGKVKAGR